ncbi:MAG: ABC transporter ATP-binding protein, partial [Acidobacteria bacterium]|nr:ABC transporter ATP-binding protein [Acidobacteriota bacterium]
HRCVRRIEEFLSDGRTLLFVSHSLDLVERLCDRVLWLDRGQPKLLGSPRRVIDAYRQSVAEEEGKAHGEAAQSREAQEESGIENLRWGSREAEIRGVRILDSEGREAYVVRSGEAFTIELEAVARRSLTDFVFGIAVSTPRGVECWGTNTDLAGFGALSFEGEARVRVECPSLRLGPGEYHLDVAVHSRDGAPYDYRRKILTFTVTSAEKGIGVYFPEHRWTFSGGATVREPRR